MQVIGALDAKNRLVELLDRVSQGESFEIVSHGRAVGRLLPPLDGRNNATSSGAIERILSMRSEIHIKSTQEEISQAVREGRRI